VYQNQGMTALLEDSAAEPKLRSLFGITVRARRACCVRVHHVRLSCDFAVAHWCSSCVATASLLREACWANRASISKRLRTRTLTRVGCAHAQHVEHMSALCAAWHQLLSGVAQQRHGVTEVGCRARCVPR
jgi:hypothetical protein